MKIKYHTWDRRFYEKINIHITRKTQHEKSGKQEKKVQSGKSVRDKECNMERVSMGNMYRIVHCNIVLDNRPSNDWTRSDIKVFIRVCLNYNSAIGKDRLRN